MLRLEENERLTRVGPGTPMGRREVFLAHQTATLD
jgi:hypothetical protein